MRKMIFITVAALGLLTVTNVCAQRTIAEAAVPFNFMVANTVLPSGTYQIAECASHVMIIRNCDTNLSVLTATWANYEKPMAPAKLVFHQYGKQYFLSEVHVPNVQGATIPTSAQEKAAKLQYATVRTTEKILIPNK